MLTLPPPVAEVKPASIVRTLTDREFRAFLLQQAATLDVDADDYRPSVGPDYIPTVEEEAEAAELLNGEEEMPVDSPAWDELAGASLALATVEGGYAWM